MILNKANMSYMRGPPREVCKRTQHYDSGITHEEPETWVHQETPQVLALVSGHVRTGLQVAWLEFSVLSAPWPLFR